MTSDNPRLVIGLVGRKGSGKGTVAKLLKERYGAEVFRYSGILADVLTRLAMDHTHENLIRLSIVLREGFGEDVLKKTMITDVKKSQARMIVIDGIRRLADLEGLDGLGSFHLVNVVAPPDVRFGRITQRREKTNDVGMSFEEFNKLNEAPTEITIGDVEAKAGKTIDNGGDQEALMKQIEEMMGELNPSLSS